MEKLSIILGKGIQKISKIRGGGSALPGLVVEKTNPEKNIDMNIIQTYIKIVLPFFFKKRYNVFSHLCFFHK